MVSRFHSYSTQSPDWSVCLESHRPFSELANREYEYGEVRMISDAQRANIQRLRATAKAKATFTDGEDFIKIFEQYIDVVNDDPKRVPSYSDFAKWLGDLSPSSIYNFLGKYPSAHTITKHLLADSIVQHAMNGGFRDAVAIFTLKNKCDWTDKRESTTKSSMNGDIATPDEARRNVRAIMNSLGFDDHGRPGRKGKANMAAMESRIIELAEAKAE